MRANFKTVSTVQSNESLELRVGRAGHVSEARFIGGRFGLGFGALAAAAWMAILPPDTWAQAGFGTVTGLSRMAPGIVLVAEGTMDELFEPEEPEADHKSGDKAAAPTTPPESKNPGVGTSGTATSPGPEPVPPSASAKEAQRGAPPESKTPVVEDAAPAPAPAAQAAANWPKISGFLQNETAYTYSEPDHLSKFKMLAKISAAGRLSENVKWQLAGKFFYDPNYDFNHFYNKEVRADQRVDGYIDETFIDIDAGAWDFRVGRQHIVWGEMVGLFFADVVSALDLREFILPDFENIRIPQWAARSEYFNGDFHGELIWLPYVTSNEAGKYGSDYFVFPVQLPRGVTARVLEDKTPHDIGSDSAYGLRGGYLWNGWDLSAFYYTSPDRNAALERSLLPPGSNPTMIFQPEHNRIHQFGATLAKDFGSIVLKTEAIETKDRLVSITRLSEADGLGLSDEFRYVVGADWAGYGHNVNVQFFQTWLQDHDPDMIYRELESGMSVLFSTTRLHPDVTPELLWIRSLNRNEWLLEAKLVWNVAANWRASVGADVFEGPPTGILGEFRAKDRVYYELRYSF